MPHFPRLHAALATAGAILLAAIPARAQDHHHTAPGLLGIRDVLALPHNRSRPNAIGHGEFLFEVTMTSEDLPARVFEPNPFDERERSILECAHGGFAFDYREGKGEVYWFLQGAGILRIKADRSAVELLDTDPAMRDLNMHNATFFEHDGEGRIAWPANDAAKVFVTDVDGVVLHTIPRPTVAPYSDGAGFSPTDTDYLDGLLWVTDGYGSRFVMPYDLAEAKWDGMVFGGISREIQPGKFGTNHGITIHRGLLHVSGRYFARIHTYRSDTSFVRMFPLPDGSKPCDFEFFVVGGKLYGVAASLNTATDSDDTGAAIYIVDMDELQIVATVKPRDELDLESFFHLHNVFPVVDDGRITLFCQAWSPGDFAVLRQVLPAK